jgi:hypothetical protein
MGAKFGDYLRGRVAFTCAQCGKPIPSTEKGKTCPDEICKRWPLCDGCFEVHSGGNHHS